MGQDEIKSNDSNEKLKESKFRADSVTDPAINATLAINTFYQHGSPDLLTVVENIRGTVKEVNDGSMKPAEEILVAQAKTLDSLFLNFIEIAAKNVDKMPVFDSVMKIALRAQSQCRATLQTLGEVKNPKSVAFVQQANIAHGPQQVNNGVAGDKKQIEQNKLSGQRHELLQDTRASQDESRVNTQIEALGKVDRA